MDIPAPPITMKTINLVQDFTDVPGGRYRELGPYSGEEFREDYLIPALKQHSVVQVILNGALGLPSSFIDEAFGSFAKEYQSGKLVIILDDHKIAAQRIKELLASVSI